MVDMWKFSPYSQAEGQAVAVRNTTHVSTEEATLAIDVGFTGNGTVTEPIYFESGIEDVRSFQNQDVAISVQSGDIVSAESWKIQLIQDFGSGGATDVITESAPFTLDSNTLYTAVLSVPSTSGKARGDKHHLRVRITSVGTLPEGVYEFHYVQLEEGEVATSFEHRPLGLEFIMCQQYYVKLPQITFYVTKSTTQDHRHANVSLPTAMRRLPITQMGTFLGFTGGITESWDASYAIWDLQLGTAAESGVADPNTFSRIAAGSILKAEMF
jgi:hypothetical protein